MNGSELGLCSRCGLDTGDPRPERSGDVLCDACAALLEKVGNCAISLTSTLMEWGRLQEWAKTEKDVIIEALQMSAWLFEERVRLDRPLASGPRLLSTALEDDEVVITLGADKSLVWNETFGSWESGHDRVIFQTAIDDQRRIDDALTIYYWDRSEDRYKERTCWSVDEGVVPEFSDVVRTRSWGVPRTRVVVSGLAAETLEKAGSDIASLVSALGLYPRRSRYDRNAGIITTEAIGDLNEARKSGLANLIPRRAGRQGASVAFEPGGFRD